MRRGLRALAIVACAWRLGAQEVGPAVVKLADGTSLPLVPWSLSYEYAAWNRGSEPGTSPQRTEARELRLGKKTYPVSGSVLAIEYEEVTRSGDDGQSQKVPVPRSLTLTGSDGKRTTLKPEPPARELLAPGADKNLLVQPRSLDLRGRTLTGTQREFCLLSFTALIECNVTTGQQVVRIEFPK